MKRFNKITSIIIMLGTIGYIINSIFNRNSVSFLHPIVISGETYYTYDLLGYIKNIKETITDLSILELATPEREWSNAGNIQAIINNLVVIFNWIYMPINVILWPIRIVGYLLLNLLALIGINIQNPTYSSGLIKTLTWITQNLSIPYI